MKQEFEEIKTEGSEASGLLQEKYLQFRRLVDIYYDVQDVRIRTENRLRINVPSEVLGTYPEPLRVLETQLKSDIMRMVEVEPIWKHFLGKWRGIGPCIAGGLIANIEVRFVQKEPENDLERAWMLKTKDKKTLVPVRRGIDVFTTPSKLWKFCGLDVRDGKAPKRVHGDRNSVTWSPKMRVLCWKLAKQTVIQGRYYRKLYVAAKAKYDGRPDLQEGKGAKGHRNNMAMRKMAKQFMLDLWVAWREMLNLPTMQPYPIDKLGHTSYQKPPLMGDREPTEEFKPVET